MNLQEVKSQKFSPAARYIKESLFKSIDNHLSKSDFLVGIIRPKGEKFWGCFFFRPKGGKFF